MITRITNWLKRWLWADDLRRLPRWRAFGLACVRVLAHGIQGFSKNLLGLQAGGLTMLTLLGMVPMLWLGLAVARWLGFSERLEQELRSIATSEDLPGPFREAIANFHSAADRVTVEALSLFGVLILAYSGYSLFITIEQTFNRLWKAQRWPWYGRLGSFVGVVLIVPFLVFVAVLAQSVLEEGSLVIYMRESLPWLAKLYDAGMNFAPLVVVWIAFTMLYKLMPSATVRWRAACIAGGVAALGLIGLHVAYVQLQIGLVANNKVYGALAAVPMLIAYISLAWTVTLVGAQVSYAIQNVHDLGPPQRVPEAAHGSHRRLALSLALAVSEAPVSLSSFSQRLGVPRAWVDDVVEDLVGAGLLRVSNADEAWAVSKTESLTMWDIVRAVESHDRDRDVFLPDHIAAPLQAMAEDVEARLDQVALQPPESGPAAEPSTPDLGG